MREKILKSGRVVLITAGAILILYALAIPLFFRYNAGVLFSAVGGAILIACGIFLKTIVSHLYLWLPLTLAFLFLIFLLVFPAIVGKCRGANGTEDAVIVLGAGLNGDQPSRLLKLRLDRALSYLNENPDAVVIVSGGQGTDEEVSEASAMRAYLIENGVSSEKILTEEKSTSTRENLIFTKTILDSYFDGKTYRCAVVTSDFHVYRALRIADAVGLDASGVGAPAAPYAYPMYLLREAAAILESWFFGAV